MFTIQNNTLTLKNTERKQTNIIFCADYKKLMEMHCFLNRQLKNTVCKIKKNYAAQLTQIPSLSAP